MRYNQMHSEAYVCDTRPAFDVIMSDDTIFVRKKTTHRGHEVKH